MKKKLEKLLANFKKGGYSAMYNDWFKAVQVKVSVISIDSLKAEMEEKGYKAWIKKAPELGKFPVCNDPSLSGKDEAAYLMVS
jgi:hypothetical protein